MKPGTVAACSAALTFALLALSAQYAAAQLADPGPPGDAAPPPSAGPPGGPPAGTGPGAVATTNVNLRQGPGTTYTIITTIPAGAPVDVAGCSGQWCQVTYQGQNGYVIATSLGPGGAGGPPPGAAAAAYPPGYVPPPVYVAPPPYYYGGYYGYGPYYYGGRGGYYRRW